MNQLGFHVLYLAHILIFLIGFWPFKVVGIAVTLAGLLLGTLLDRVLLKNQNSIGHIATITAILATYAVFLYLPIYGLGLYCSSVVFIGVVSSKAERTR